MDRGLPRGGLTRLFHTFDVARDHFHGRAHDHDAPPWEPRESAPESAAAKAPEEVAPEKVPAAEPGRADLFDRMDAGEKRLKEREDGPAPRQGLFDRMEAGEKRLAAFDPKSNGATVEQDERGLRKAYADESGPGVFYDPDTRTEYIKGTSTARDVYDDVKIPFGLTRHAERYQQAESSYRDLQAQGHPVDRVVGHSLGGSVALQMQRDHGIRKSRTYGAPVLDLFGEAPDRLRHPWDPVSVLDRAAARGPPKRNPHGYENFYGRE